MHQHPITCHVVDVVQVHFEVVDRFWRIAGSDAGDARRTSENSQGFAGAEVAGGDEVLAILAPEGVRRRAADGLGKVREAEVQDLGGVVVEGAGDDAAAAGGIVFDGWTCADVEKLGVAVDAALPGTLMSIRPPTWAFRSSSHHTGRNSST